MTEDTLKRSASPVDGPDAKKSKTVEVETPKKGIAYVKKEFIVDAKSVEVIDDDSAEQNGDRTEEISSSNGKKGKRTRGQNKNRELKQQEEENKLCSSLIDPDANRTCKYGAEKCRFVHDVKEYLAHKKPEIEGVCPVFNALGYCPAGFKCRFLHSHMDSDMNLIKDHVKMQEAEKTNYELNGVTSDQKFALMKKKFEFKYADEVCKIMNNIQDDNKKKDAARKKNRDDDEDSTAQDDTKEAMNNYLETKFYASEKKKLDLVNKKIVSPLTTVGNLPYRRLMRTLGADVTYSEMALSLPLIQGTNSEWALPKAHCTEYPGFGVQIAAAKHWQGAKAAEAIARYCPNVSELNLNSGCPIDLLYRQGAGSGLLDQPARLIRILQSMNYCSGDIPTTLKIRMGTRDEHPIAHNLVKRVVNETQTAAITLHGRSRQQRYTKEANWDYVAEVGKALRDAEHEVADDKDRRDFQRINFVGNGDCYNWDDWYRATDNEYIDSVMVARGALIKPWIFEEVDSKQYQDKSATERLEMIKTYANFALEHWGSDEYGVNLSRRYLCEFMSFFHRYIPYGILERYPIKLNERPQNWKGRNELETLLGSNDYKDWIKISEMFLGPADDGFKFTPKHKSSSYENNRN
ncbi:tRNA dihydrouridine synthase DUS3 [Cyberlindnera jadinii NRRL Y-1542]|uniref:tRNA-dihydrouridine(47) synthase [NAD(P)(+)] n=1 Tax=Cyberlindnera jadinii (strain ATCC 18201 / CBS 1600 / BCRC 20928 / JCM 3617 / NBRC 0987 / NRRL Y-1542) TaxID=983966 RepID=A0A1E4S283_CYBJN|nr:Dus-domain-containing protein [Cyberlindnera jadinii NRRL Y-1542]ODV73634.1 Dus-domain-containing protein [Cyberlindnera jadinii NRRL Y-1542]